MTLLCLPREDLQKEYPTRNTCVSKLLNKEIYNSERLQYYLHTMWRKVYKFRSNTDGRVNHTLDTSTEDS